MDEIAESFCFFGLCSRDTMNLFVPGSESESVSVILDM